MNDPQIIGGLSPRQFGFSRWIFVNQQNIWRTTVGILIFLNVVLWGYSLYGWLDYYVLSANRYRDMISQMTISGYDMTTYKNAHQPQDLAVANPQVLAGTAGRYDFLANAKNPNAAWLAKIEYHFVGAGDYVGKKLQTFILPLDEKPIVDLAVNSITAPRNVDLVIDDLSWKKAPDYENYRNQVLQVEIFDLAHVDSQTAGLGNPSVSQTRFSVKNNSAYDYWTIGWYVLLYRGSQLVGINYLLDEEFLSGQTKNFAINWFSNISSVTSVKVIPDINILDRAVFRLPIADSGELK